jgi:hypothetical protein
MTTPLRLLKGKKIQLVEKGIEVILKTASFNEEIRIKEFLNSSRLKITQDIFDKGFNFIEVHKEGEEFVRLGIEAQWGRFSIDKK